MICECTHNYLITHRFLVAIENLLPRLGGDGGLLAGVLSSWLGIVSSGLIVLVLLLPQSDSAVLINPGVCSVILESSSGDIFSYTYNKLLINNDILTKRINNI